MNRLGIVTIFALTLGAPVAQAAPPDFCRDYARSAVEQTHRGFSIPYCARGMNGGRWSEDFRGHFDWCRGVSFEDADREREARHRYLERCQGR